MSVATSRIDGRRCPSVARPPPPTSPHGAAAMSRVQLALRVADLEASIDFYSRLFATSPAKRRPGYANFALTEPPLKLVLLEGEAGEETRMDHLGVEVEDTDLVAAATHRLAGAGLRHPGRGQHHLLLRRPGQGLGHRPRQRAVGGLHRHRRRARRPRREDQPGVLRGRRRRHLLHHHPHQYGDRPGAHRHRCLLLSNTSPPRPGCRPGPGRRPLPSRRTAIARWRAPTRRSHHWQRLDPRPTMGRCPWLPPTKAPPC